jgi:hypothetical protein
MKHGWECRATWKGIYCNKQTKKQQMSLLQQYCTSLKMPLPVVHFDRWNPMGAANHPGMLRSFDHALHQL